MATLYLTNSSPGAPILNAVNGSLNAVLDWALVQNGWSIEFTSANARVYRAGTGHRRRLYVAHDSALSGNVIFAVIRGAEGATSTTALVDPFPTVTQAANAISNVLVGVNTTPKEYRIIVSPTYIKLVVSTAGSNTANWDGFIFGDLPPTRSEDTWNTAIAVGGTGTSNPPARSFSSPSNSIVTGGNIYWCRSIDGSIKSTKGCFTATVTNSFCSAPGTPVARAGYLNQIVREKVAASCCGGSTGLGPLALVRRAWVPNMWNLLHLNSGSLTSDDTFTDSAYSPASQFCIVSVSTSISIVIESSDTWSPPI